MNAYLFYSPAPDRLTSMNEDRLEGGSEAFRLVVSDKVTSSRLWKSPRLRDDNDWRELNNKQNRKNLQTENYKGFF